MEEQNNAIFWCIGANSFIDKFEVNLFDILLIHWTIAHTDQDQWLKPTLFIGI